MKLGKMVMTGAQPAKVDLRKGKGRVLCQRGPGWHYIRSTTINPVPGMAGKPSHNKCYQFR